MSEINIFEKATRGKYRYHFNGQINTEDLFDLSVEELDKIFKELNGIVKQADEESLLDNSSMDDKLSTKIEIIKYIVKAKLEEKEANQLAKEKAIQRQKILAIMAERDDEELKNMSKEELEEMLNKM